MRVFRVIGGFCILLVLRQIFLNFTEVLRFTVLIIALIHFILIEIILLIRIVYSIYTLLKKSKEFEVRN